MKTTVIALLLTLNVYAAEMSVLGSNTNDDACKHYSTTTGDFTVTYEENIPWGSTVELISAYKDTFSSSNWYKELTVPMKAIGPYTWQANFQDTTSMRGYFYASELNFVFRITMPDGSKYYDNGGQSSLGHYSVKIPSVTCDYNDKRLLTITAL